MPDYTYGDYIYFNNNIDTHNEHHNYFILNHIPDFYITSPSKLMDDKFTSSPKLFFDKMIEKMDELPYPSCGSVIKSRKMEQIESTDGTNVYCKIGNDEYF